VDNLAKSNHLLSEQIDQQQWRVAFWAVAAQADSGAKKLAVWAAALADTALTAAWAFVHRVCHDRLATLELTAELLLIWQAGLMAQAEGLLLVSTRAVAGAG
jgi:hypothetical protein